MNILETAAFVVLCGCILIGATAIGIAHLRERLNIRRKLRRARMVSGHPRIEQYDAVYIARQGKER